MKKILLSFILLSLLFSKVKAQKLDFTGSGNSVQTTYALDITNGFTIEYWVYLNNWKNFNGTVSQGQSNQPAPLDVYFNSGGNLNVLYGNGTNIAAHTTTNMQFAVGQWYHITHTYDPTSNNGKLYVNDSLIATLSIPAASLANASGNILYLGTRADNVTNADITMKDLKVWSGAQAPTLSACLIGTETNLQVYYKMNEGTGTTLTDYATANGSNDGTFVGTLAWESLQTPAVTISSTDSVVVSTANETFTATISGDVFGANYQWYKNGAPIGTDSVQCSTSIIKGDSISVQISSAVPCLTTPATTSGKISVEVLPLPKNSTPYPSGSPCFSVGNLTFCDVLSYNWGNFYGDLNGIGGSDLSDVSINSTGQQSTYSGAFEVAVNDIAFTKVPTGAYVDTLNNVIQTDTQAIAGLYVSKEFRFFEKQPVVRLNVQLNNPTASPITVRVDVASIFGSGNSTILDSSSTGGTSATDDDRWIITNDQVTSDNEPTITSIRFGKGSIQAQPHFNQAPDLSGGAYDDSIIVTVPANSNKYVVLFNRIDSTVAAAKANVSLFDSTRAMIADSLFAGLDRTNVVNWALCLNSSSVVTATACGSYTWQGTTYTSSGTYHATIPNAAGCDSLMTLNLTINQYPDATTSVADPTITANATGASYQWIDCNNTNAVIPGETNQSFTATQNGSYAVVVTANGCADTSVCVTISSIVATGVTSSNALDMLTVSPNPSNGIFTINAPADYTLSVLSVVGEEKLSQTGNSGANTLDLSVCPNGVYFLNVRTATTSRTIKVVKE